MKTYVKTISLKSAQKACLLLLGFCLLLVLALPSYAQRGNGPVPVAAPGRAEAPIDLTGNWVSVVNEDWAYRMLTPAIGDTMSIPLKPNAQEVADNWDLEADNAAGLQCKAFGAARIMRVPTRLKISWQDDYTLRIDTDSGSQTRLFHFSDTGRRPLLNMMLEGATREKSLQGYSVADWENIMINRVSTAGPDDVPPPGGNLKVITTRLEAGYLRPNGVPYSEDTVLTEFYNRLTDPQGEEWFVVTTIVDDPTYLNSPYVTTTHFRREADDSKWNPSPCETLPPPEGATPPAGRDF